MLSLLEQFNYTAPKLKEEKWDNIEIKSNGHGYYYLMIDDVQWMDYDANTHLEAYEVYSHYRLAKGHVVVTGLGFGVRENWILTKNDVTKLTIIEKNKSLIDYHLKNNSSFLQDKRVEIINCDALDYKNSCDVLLLDHYELDVYENILANVKQIHDNVNCETMWFWPFERIIMHSRRWFSFNEEPYSLITKYEAFNKLKKHWELYKIPEFNEQEINLFCMMFHSKLFSNSEWVLNECFANRNDYQEIYRCI
jgi:hypothetical protein